MGFFNSIAGMLDGYSVQLTVDKDDNGNLTVMFLPKLKDADKLNKEIIPLVLTGSADDLDSNFVALVSSSTDEISKIQTNINEFVASLKSAEIKDNKKNTKTSKPAKKEAKQGTLIKEEPKVEKPEDKKETNKSEPVVTNSVIVEKTPKTEPKPDGSEPKKSGDDFGEDDW
jgi:PRTRC genetic system protein E